MYYPKILLHTTTPIKLINQLETLTAFRDATHKNKK